MSIITVAGAIEIGKSSENTRKRISISSLGGLRENVLSEQLKTGTFSYTIRPKKIMTPYYNICIFYVISLAFFHSGRLTIIKWQPPFLCSLYCEAQYFFLKTLTDIIKYILTLYAVKG